MAATEELLGMLHDSLASDLLRRFKEAKENPNDLDKQLSPQELNQVRQFLKDNDITAIPAKGSALDQLAEQMPDFTMEGGLHGNC